MAENTKIEWAHHTFNPWIGCQKVGPGCDHCYAEAWDARGLQGHAGRWGPDASRTRTSAANWRKPLAWDRAAAAAGERHRVFCASLADVFDNHGSITSGWRGDLWHLIARTPNLDWMLLTNRPGNISRMLPDGYGAPAWGDGWPNVWLGCTVVNQAEADRDIPKLLEVPARVRFLSMEPLLGPVTKIALDGIHLVIVGGESGQGARPMHPDWVRSLRDQCVTAGVAFHFKQWGEWAPAMHDPEYDGYVLRQTEAVGLFDSWRANVYDPDRLEGINWRRLGKKAAGRLLDGRTWDQMPENKK